VKGIVSFTSVTEASIDTNVGRFDFASGAFVAEATSPSPEGLFGSLAAFGRGASNGDTPITVWDGDLVKLTVDRKRTPFNLTQFDPKSKRIVGKLTFNRPVYDDAYVSGKPESGWMFVSGATVHTGRQAVMSHLVLLSPPRFSPLRFILYHDIRNLNQALGVSISPKQSFQDVAGMAYTPSTPLAMGNAYTGRIAWTNEWCAWGNWVGKNVLAQTRRGQNWQVLDGRSGKAVPSNLPQLAGSLAQHDVRVVGKNILVRKTARDERSTTITCYTLER
jgi:hypothetical protein